MTPKSPQLKGSLPVIPTPFYKGRIDYQSLERLFDHLFPVLDGCTIGGSTGESVSLSLSERCELMKFAAQNAPAGKIIVAGLTHTDIQEVIKLASYAADVGIHAGLIPAPYYFPADFPMVLEFFRTVSANTQLDLVFYDNPLYTKVWLRTEELLQLLESCPRFTGIKLTDHDLSKIAGLKKSRSALVFSGDDVVAFGSLLLGVDGSMIIAPAVFPEEYQQTVQLLARGNSADALRLFSQTILPFIHLFGPGDEVATTKALFHELGMFRSMEVRPPLLPAISARRAEVMLAYDVCRGGREGVARQARVKRKR
jgi:4-hydroxy-tetrahydrodipicolinate synthase